MKPFVRLAPILILAILVFGCSSKNRSETAMSAQYKDAPEWVFHADAQPPMAAVGMARIGKAGLGFARNAALADGRDQLARQMEVKVKNMVKQFTRATGSEGAETVDTVSEQVSRQVSHQTLAGSRMKAMWRAPTEELFVLVVIDANRVLPVVRDAMESSMKNQEALWQQFQGMKAQEALDFEIEREFGSPVP